MVDDRGPGFAAKAAPGGTALFRDQAACAFRAFAARRLGSQAPEVPQPGLSAAERGTLVHAVLAAAWSDLRDKAALDAMPGDQLEAMLKNSGFNVDFVEFHGGHTIPMNVLQKLSAQLELIQ